MELPWKFPSAAEQLRKKAEAFQRLSPAERFAVIDELHAFGQMMIQQSPNRERILRRQEAEEAEWQRIQKELFSRYEARCRTGSPSVGSLTEAG